MRILPWLGLLGVLTSPLASAAGPRWTITDMPRFWILGEGNFHLGADGNLFVTKENYDQDGYAVSPPAMTNLKDGELRLHTGFGFSTNFSAFFQADIRNVIATNPATGDQTNRGFGDAFLAGRYLLYRSKSSDRVYPTEWTPESWLTLFEGSWVFPLYDRAATGLPPLGDQSNDLTAMFRFAWYANEWFAASAGVGYTYRTAGYAAAIPWTLRADFLPRHSKFRFWGEVTTNESAAKNAVAFNPQQPDPVPGGSLIFKSQAPVLRVGSVGLGYMVSKEWEIAGAGQFTATGVSAAKGVGGTLGLVWRPYQMAELRYDEYREQQIQRLRQEKRDYAAKPVVSYGFQATVLKISSAGNFLKIGYGRQDGVKVGDLFQVFAPDNFDQKSRSPLALARVHTARVNDSFLRVEQRYQRDVMIKPGYEVRRVILEE